MDTFSHITMGLGLGALAQIDPFVADHSALSQAIILGTVIGSNAPDFDFVYRLFGKGSYIRNHRAISHSLLAMPLWSLAVSGIVYSFLPGSSFLHLFLWTFIAVILHVIVDLLNVDGTQIFRPFTKKWVTFDSLPLIDPVILLAHLIGFGLLPFFEPGKMFLIIYIVLFLYFTGRILSAVLVKRTLELHFVNSIRIKIIPRIFFFEWDVIIETKEDFLFGILSAGSLTIEHSFAKKIDFPELVSASKNHPSVSDFLSSTHYAYPFVQERKNGYLIYWKDLRFRTKKFFPTLAILFISSDFKMKNCYIGKIHSIKHYKQVIKKLKNPKNFIESPQVNGFNKDSGL